MTEIVPEDQGHVVHEAIGPSLTPLQAGAVTALGILSLLCGGVQPILLDSMATAHRMTESGMGLAATAETLTFATVTGLAGIALPPKHLKLIGALAALALAAAEFATLWANNDIGVLTARALAGVPEGVLLWISIGMISRAATPERWAGVLLTGMTLAQLGVSAIFTVYIMPTFSANGGWVTLAAISLLGILIAMLVPSEYAALPDPDGHGGIPPLRGWVALFATLLYAAAPAAIYIYVLPLAHQAGLSGEVGSISISVALATQIVACAASTAAAGHVRYMSVFVWCAVASLAVWFIYANAPPAWLFIAATALGCAAGIFNNPFFTPLAIDADPSRRAAVQTGAAQQLSLAVGPFLASFVVADGDVRNVLYLAGGLLLSGLAVMLGLRVTAKQPALTPAAAPLE